MPTSTSLLPSTINDSKLEEISGQSQSPDSPIKSSQSQSPDSPLFDRYGRPKIKKLTLKNQLWQMVLKY